MSKRTIRKRRHRWVRKTYKAASITISIGGVEFTPKSVTYHRRGITNTCGKQLDCGGECFLWIGHPGECECKGDEPGQPGTCPA